MRSRNPSTVSHHRLLSATSIVVVAGALMASAEPAPTLADSRAQVLRDQHDALLHQLTSNPFQRPLYLFSTQGADDVRGEVYAVVEHPFALVSTNLRDAEHWCDILMLHLNIKACRASGGATSRHIDVSAGRKRDDPISPPHHMQFDYQLLALNPDYLQVRLSAGSGPLGTRNYRIDVAATPLAGQRSFLHLSYSYSYGTIARLAMQGYLTTLGRDKIGFSVVGRQANGQPIYVDGVRGVIERNTMRYYLAIGAYLDSLSQSPAQRVEQRLKQWFASTERYRRQLHEIEREDYLRMKREQLKLP